MFNLTSIFSSLWSLINPIAWLLGLISLFGLSGCTFTLTGSGEMGVRQASSWALYHETEAADENDVATSNTDLSEGINYIKQLQDTPETPTTPSESDTPDTPDEGETDDTSGEGSGVMSEGSDLPTNPS